MERPPQPANAFAPDTAGLTETYAAAAKLSPASQSATSDMFHGLFRTSGAAEPVAPLINSLWTTPPQPDAGPRTKPTPILEPTKPAEAPAAAPMGSNELGLFQDQLPDARALFRGRV